MYTRKEIEKVDGFVVELPEGLTPEHATLVKEYFRSILDEATSVDHLNLNSLKLISIAFPFPDTVYRWQRELGLHERVTLTPQGVAVGKELTWKNSKGEINSLIVFSAEIYFGMLENNSFAKAMFFHELAHVHDESRRCICDGYIKRVYPNELPKILQFTSGAIWGEYFAERVACRHLTDQDFDLIRENTKMIAERFNDLEAKRKAYRLHGDITRFWQEVLSSLSTCSTALGRLLGSFCEKERGLVPHSFVEDFSFSPEWKGIAQDLRLVLDEIYLCTWHPDLIKKIEPYIMRMMFASSVVPREASENGVYIDVPHTSKDEL